MVLYNKFISGSWYCTLIFTTLLLLQLVIIKISFAYSPSLSNALLWFMGWFTWTFIEYMGHRFVFHTREYRITRKLSNTHLYHHKHPTEIKISSLHRTVLLGISLLSVLTASMINSYLFIISGIICGYSLFILMHYILHQKWSARLFPRLHRYHIYHHMIYPHLCHGISVTWWDRICGTVPEEKIKLSDRILLYYYGNGKA